MAVYKKKFFCYSKTKSFSKDLKKTVLEMAFNAGSKSAHLGGALSCLDLLAVLFNDIINFDNKLRNNINRDRFILSKGHACLALYSVLNKLKILSKKKIKSFETNNTDLPGHPVKNYNLGIETTSGSLGMGLSVGVGLCIAAKKLKKNLKTYVLIGDGECNEGSVWESAMSAGKYKLDNLTAIIDMNKFQQTGTTVEILPIKNIDKIWKNFGWNIQKIDGHNLKQIYKAFKIKSSKPKLILAKTIKGKGVAQFENNNKWHHNIITKEIYKVITSKK